MRLRPVTGDGSAKRPRLADNEHLQDEETLWYVDMGTVLKHRCILDVDCMHDGFLPKMVTTPQGSTSTLPVSSFPGRANSVGNQVLPKGNTLLGTSSTKSSCSAWQRVYDVDAGGVRGGGGRGPRRCDVNPLQSVKSKLTQSTLFRVMCWGVKRVQMANGRSFWLFGKEVASKQRNQG